MVNFHVIDIRINVLHVKRQLYLPVYIKRITGVMFFPVVPIPIGVPDGNPLGVAALSLENEKVNVVTNMPVFKKAPCYHQGIDLADAGGEIFLDSGYNGHKDFYACNDTVSPNSYVVFKYTNRKNIKSLTEFEQFEIDMSRLKSLEGKRVIFDNYEGILVNNSVGTTSDTFYFRIRRSIISLPRRFSFRRMDLKTVIYEFLKPVEEGEPEPFFHDEEKDYDEPYNLKIVLRHEFE